MRKIFTVFLISFFYVPFAQAQNTDEHLDIEKIWNAVKSKLPTFSGYVDVRYRYSDDENSFDIAGIRLNMRGKFIDKFGYNVQVHYLKSISMRNIFLHYDLDPRLTFKVGQMKLPFSLENPYASPQLEVVDYAMSIRGLSAFSDVSGVSSAGRDIGASLSGKFIPRNDFSVIEYEIGIYNGNGINTSDNNKHKDFVGRVNVFPIKELTLSGSFYIGKYSYDATDLDLLGTKNRFAFGARYAAPKFTIRTEYLWGKTHQIKSKGYYALANYEFLKNLRCAIRYDYWKADKSISNGWQRNYVVGIDFRPFKYLRMQANYSYRTFHDSDNNNGQLTLMVSGIF